MDGEHLNDELAHKVQVWFLLPGDAHPQPPGVDLGDAQVPAVDAEPPLFDAVGDPYNNNTLIFLTYSY